MPRTETATGRVRHQPGRRGRGRRHQPHQPGLKFINEGRGLKTIAPEELRRRIERVLVGRGSPARSSRGVQ